jgi:dephospho-CoA kinase
MKTKIIGISGKAGVGKDTVGKIIQFLTLDDDVFSKTNRDCIADLEHKAYCASQSKWKIKKYASTLKKITSIILGCKVNKLEDRDFKEKELGKQWQVIDYTLTPRLLLQRLGTDAARYVHPDIWVNALFSKFKKKSRWIITDVRFDNEVRAIQERGGIVIRVNRDESKDSTEHSNHPSETALDNYEGFDVILNNNDTLEDLIEEIRQILIKYKIK